MYTLGTAMAIPDQRNKVHSALIQCRIGDLPMLHQAADTPGVPLTIQHQRRHPEQIGTDCWNRSNLKRYYRTDWQLSEEKRKEYNHTSISSDDLHARLLLWTLVGSTSSHLNPA